jgi:hypothetical protein
MDKLYQTEKKKKTGDKHESRWWTENFKIWRTAKENIEMIITETIIKDMTEDNFP